MDDEEEEQPTIMQCRYCGNKTVFIPQGSYYQKEYFTLKVSGKKFDFCIWKFWSCATCSKPTIERIDKTSRFSWDHPDDGGYEHEDVISETRNIIYPIDSSILVSLPSPDMPEDVAEDFNEARNIFGYSPRSSAALLRLAVQKLCIHLGQSGKNINNDIAALVKNGLSPQIQKSLDIVRVIGNNAVHPGEIDIQENRETVLALFDIINFIVQEMITRPREINEIYQKLPENALKGIEARDKKVT
jgi:hypothetical protein